MKHIIIISLLLITFSSSFAAENENFNPVGGEFGFLASTGYNSTSIGLIYNLSSNIAILPSFSIYNDNSFIQKYYGGSLNLNYYFFNMNNFSSYFGIGGGYAYEYYEYSPQYPDGIRERTDYYTIKGFFGARYMITSRIAIFSDIGFYYTRENNKYTYYDSTTTATKKYKYWHNRYSTRSAELGVIFYFIK